MGTGNQEQIFEWKLAPFIRLLFPLIAGILTEDHFPIQTGIPAALLFCTVLFLIKLYGISLSGYFKLEWVAWIIIQLAFFCFESLLMQVHLDYQLNPDGSNHKKEPDILILGLLNDPVSKPHSFKCLTNLRGNWNGQSFFYENDTIFIQFSRNINSSLLNSGSWIASGKNCSQLKILNLLQTLIIKNSAVSGIFMRRYF